MSVEGKKSLRHRPAKGPQQLLFGDTRPEKIIAAEQVWKILQGVVRGEVKDVTKNESTDINLYDPIDLRIQLIVFIINYLRSAGFIGSEKSVKKAQREISDLLDSVIPVFTYLGDRYPITNLNRRGFYAAIVNSFPAERTLNGLNRGELANLVISAIEETPMHKRMIANLAERRRAEREDDAETNSGQHRSRRRA